MDRKLIEQFKTPDVIYRSAPFWAWNDILNIEKLRLQIDKMKEGGFGGGFIHSRIGLITPYLSSKWIECVIECVKYAEKNGMKMYLYDEDRWPSGFAGGVVSKKKENRIKFLKIWKKNKKWNKKIVNGAKTDWFNGETYIDTCNKNTVDEFIKYTYERYLKELREYIPYSVPAIFTDEPSYITGKALKEKRKNIYYFPWTKDFRNIFKKKYGYDIYTKINLLFEEKNGFEKIRYDYYRLLTELFTKSFAENIYNFCEKNKISLTGHYLNEDKIELQTSAVGDVMSLYEFMQWPGVDHLERNIKNPLTLKQCSSVANQLGKERVLSELYGCSGHNLSLADRKWIGDWHISLGINFFCPHLYLYSLKGCRKRDYPPTISPHQPYWKYQKEIEDYFARLNFIMSQGRYISNILVIHPIETGWILKGSKKLNKYDDELAELTQKLLENRFEYEFGNESLIEKYGEVKEGKFIIGRGEYSYVIIPSTITLRKTTIELIKNFIKYGGKVFASEKFPYLVEGERKEIDFKKDSILYNSVDKLIEELKKLVVKDVELYEESRGEILDIFIHRRNINEDIEVVFLNNTSLQNYYKTSIFFNYSGKVYKVDLFKGNIYPIEITKSGNGMIVKEIFHPIDSKLFIIDKSEKPVIIDKTKEETIEKIEIENWKIENTSLNVLVLDYCKYKKNVDKKWSKKLPVLQIQQILEKENKKQKIDLVFEFENENFDEDIELVCEEIERYKIKINNKHLKIEKVDEWIDTSFKKVKIPKEMIKKGKNKIEMSIVFIPPKKKNTLIFKPDGVEIENIYLLGNFIVKAKKIEYKNGGYFLNNFNISKKEKAITEEDLNTQGYPFYTGSIVAIKEINIDVKEKERIFLRFEEFNGIVAKIEINNNEVGIVYFPPYEIEITKYVKNGVNNIKIELFSSLRNLLGPHHLKNHNPEYVGPSSFIDSCEKWFKSKNKTVHYSILPFGLGKICIIFKNENI
ncbi:MAG: hypothetical protein NC915_03820 [Candidatus Omnitrophica bacterium]|nr:hypothetical protein [Candidatus Omnitrophota bacterium]